MRGSCAPLQLLGPVKSWVAGILQEVPPLKNLGHDKVREKETAGGQLPGLVVCVCMCVLIPCLTSHLAAATTQEGEMIVSVDVSPPRVNFRDNALGLMLGQGVNEMAQVQSPMSMVLFKMFSYFFLCIVCHDITRELATPGHETVNSQLIPFEPPKSIVVVYRGKITKTVRLSKWLHT